MINFIKSTILPASGSVPKLIGLFLLVLLSFGLYAQDISRIFMADEPIDSMAKGKLLVAVDNLNFFKNNEYKSEYAEGYTLTGVWIRPKLLYYPDNKLRLELGGEVLAYNGSDEYKLYPWFSALYMPTRNLSFRMGNLNQDQNHGLSQPMMDSEHFLTDKPEAGIQAKFKNNNLKADLWIDWQKMIFEGDPFKEQFVFGALSELTLFRTETLELSLPLAFNGMHQGGEIDNAQGLATTWLTISEGFKLQKRLGSSLFKSCFLESSVLQSTYPEDSTALPGDYGTAFYLHAGISSNYGSISAGYWQGSNFYTPLGMPLFQNGAAGRAEATNLNRLWTFTYRFDRKIFDQSRFGFNFDLFYNPLLQQTSNSAALYLVINLSFLCRKGTT